MAPPKAPPKKLVNVGLPLDKYNLLKADAKRAKVTPTERLRQIFYGYLDDQNCKTPATA